MNVLIAEDDPVLSLMLQQMIRELNHHPDIVEKGADAVEQALACEYDLILMDIMLRDDVDGIEAYKKIREVKEIPLIYITGNTDSGYRKRADKIGFHAILPKPVSFEELKAAIEALETIR
ncbi:MAG: response regulator [Balneolaceae bacterium]